MQETAFRDWLETIDNRPLPQLRDNLARTRRVEDNFEANLDIEYESNRCENIIKMLDISNIGFNKSINLPTDKNGLASLKTAVRKYVKFRDWQKTS